MRTLVKLSLILALLVVVLGAFTRLTDAGLGCPDWPGCYGKLFVPSHPDGLDAAQANFPERPVEANKAWTEMVHRYFAGTLGIFVLIIALWSIKTRFSRHQNYLEQPLHQPIKLPVLMLIVVIIQAALGMWTVTLNLMPIVVMAHLLGGFTLLSLLFLMLLRLTPFQIPSGEIRARALAWAASLGGIILIAQIALGGWTSANYAAMACIELPVCEGNWTQKLDFKHAFSLPEADDYEFGRHTYEGRVTMHIMHRFGALVTFVFLLWLGVRLYRATLSSTIKKQASLLIGLVSLQVLLGLSNVVFKLPLSVAVMHNAVAALLLLSLVLINYTLYRKT
ncbi:COX15/CtaA family protein [Alteromonas sp. a30]|uniref:COX15/CtaA family protein n=1 Tax=Alteromonas sp. a30 TaxID=2730917 RepID=UPI002281F6C6|nr:COX15/CtaA family protein [Alteromonas sp. a30]MCY7295726.1 COX15/CtaA family protein [Alteromonas sp. a30]